MGNSETLLKFSWNLIIKRITRNKKKEEEKEKNPEQENKRNNKKNIKQGNSESERERDLRRPWSWFGNAGTRDWMGRRGLAAIRSRRQRRKGLGSRGCGISSNLRKMKTHTIAKSHLHLPPFVWHCNRNREWGWLETEIHGKSKKG